MNYVTKSQFKDFQNWRISFYLRVANKHKISTFKSRVKIDKKLIINQIINYE